MSKILFTTGLNEQGEKAFEFVLPIADLLRAKIFFLHVEHVPAVAVQASGGMLEEVMKHRQESALKGLYQLKMQTAEYAFENNTHIESDHIYTTGLVVEEIVHAAKSIKPDICIAGTGSHKGFPGLITGDVAGQLIKKLNCPLLIVPDGCDKLLEGDILFASGWDKGDDTVLDQLMTFSRQLQKKVIVLHVLDKADKNEANLEEYMEQKYAEEVKMGNLNSVVVQSESITKAIESYIDNHTVSILVSGHHHHRFEFMHRQIADNLAKNLQIPSLIFQV